MTSINPGIFTEFAVEISVADLPAFFPDPFNYNPHPLALLAAEMLQKHLKEQSEWSHNFGLKDGGEGPIIGKMFGVLVVKNARNQLGYLSSYSGKLAGGYHQSRFVPPVFDGLSKGSFLNIGMEKLAGINVEIKMLEEEDALANKVKIDFLKISRKEHSTKLQDEIFSKYKFLNLTGAEKSLYQIFREFNNSKPPSGAGECAAPRLLQYAFQNNMNPVALAEFWWGLSPKSDFWKHGQFYPACREKCDPILTHMLKGMDIEAGKEV